jgi:hypothetical protein
MPPCGIERIVRTPSADSAAIGLPRIIFIRVCGAKCNLRIEARERVDITPPSDNDN